MDVEMFVNHDMGVLVPISGVDRHAGAWTHRAFVPAPLPGRMPHLAQRTYLTIANARAALAGLDSTAQQLPNPTLLRRPTLQREAQSTSALEGTYAPLGDVLIAGEDAPPRSTMREIQNYVRMASAAFDHVADGRPLSVGLLTGLQGLLVRGTRDEGAETGRIRHSQVVVGRRPGVSASQLAVKAARFVPPPPGQDLEVSVRGLVDWMQEDRSSSMDPVVAAAMAYYQFETLHPFHDGNGRIGRLLIVLQMYAHGVLSEPTLTVSPWFEARRADYYEHLLAVSATGDWDGYIDFFATGIQESAAQTHRQMLDLVAVQRDLKDRVRASNLRADTAQLLVDYAVANPSFTVRQVERDLGISYGRANKLVQQLEELDILDVARGNPRRFFSPAVFDVLIGS